MALSRIDTTNMIEDVPQSKLDNNINFRNIIINGDMSIAQRATSVTGKTADGYYTTDRWNHSINLGTWSIDQSTDVPTGQGFAKSHKMTCTTGGATSAGTQTYLHTRLEGQNLQYLKKGTANAESLTLSFWGKSATTTGTMTIELFDTDNSRQISKQISLTTSWTKYTITYDADTTGTFNNDNGASLYVLFWVSAGSNFNSGTLSETWTSNTNANRAVGQTNFAVTNTELYITGVQLEAGTSASDFEFLPVDVNLRRCQRYYHEQGRTTTGNNYEGFCTITAYSGTSSRGIFYLPTTMRSIPSFSSNGNFALIGGSAGSVTAIALADGGGNPAVALNITASSMTAGNGFQLRSNNDADAVFKFDAEL